MNAYSRVRTRQSVRPCGSYYDLLVKISRVPNVVNIIIIIYNLIRGDNRTWDGACTHEHMSWQYAYVHYPRVHFRVVRRRCQIIVVQTPRTVFAFVNAPMIIVCEFITRESINLVHAHDSIGSIQQKLSACKQTHDCM